MGKRKLSPGQLGFAFDPPSQATGAGALAALERMVSKAVSDALHDEVRSRYEIAGKVSELLDEDVSKAMLDAYASPAREEHKVPLSRFLAIVAVTDRYDLLDRVVREIGAAVLVGEELNTARLGQIDRRIAMLRDERKRIAGSAPIIMEVRRG